MQKEIIKPGKLFPAADVRRDEFDADNQRILLADETVDIVFLGDSITEGWDVRREFFDLGNAVNRGISGDIIDVMEKRLAADVLQLKPRVAVINGGVNNMIPFFEMKEADFPAAIQEVLTTFVRAYEGIFAACRQAGQRIVASTITPLAETPSSPETQARKETAVRMNRQLLELCARYGIPCVDYHTPMAALDGVSVQPGLTRDGIHPNEAGYARMARAIRPVLTAMLARD